MSGHVDRAASVLWETSRRDEGTISATGAGIAAQALDAEGLLLTPARDARIRADALREAADALVREHGNDGFPTPWLRAFADRIEQEAS